MRIPLFILLAMILAVSVRVALKQRLKPYLLARKHKAKP